MSLSDSNSTKKSRREDIDADWSDMAGHWRIRPDTCYLNHGSFGLTPTAVVKCRQDWSRLLDEQPMDFYLRQLEPAFHNARDELAGWLNTESKNLVFVENATSAMNIVAGSFPLEPGDEVLLNNHEYGAVRRIWQTQCDANQAKLVSAHLALPLETHAQIVDSLFAKVTRKTRLIVVSHITSPTAIIMPVQEICDRAKAMGIAVCIDGPHALAQLEVDLSQLNCDFYTASCHKWLCAPLGSGFLYASAPNHSRMHPINRSWGRLLPAIPERWDEEFIWMGTRDPASFFAIPAAIKFMEKVGLESFRSRTHWLATDARKKLLDLFKTHGQTPATRQWYVTMCEVPLPESCWSACPDLQSRLWSRHGIEVPVIQFEDRWFIRVSYHLYNTTADTEKLLDALSGELKIR